MDAAAALDQPSVGDGNRQTRVLDRSFRRRRRRRRRRRWNDKQCVPTPTDGKAVVVCSLECMMHMGYVPWVGRYPDRYVDSR